MAGETYHDITQMTSSINVSTTGYSWCNNPEKVYEREGLKPSEEKPPFLIPLPGENGEIDINRWGEPYNPIADNPTLFLDFAAVEPTRDGFLTFATKYGSITESFVVLPTVKGGLVAFADSLNRWKQEQSEIKDILRLWYAISDSSSGGRSPTGITEAQYSIEDLIVVSNAIDDSKAFSFKAKNKIFQTFKWDTDILRAAEHILAECINSKLGQCKISPCLILDEDNNFVPYLVPKNLSSSLWYQLYLWISGDKSYKRCPVCGLWEDTTGLRADWNEHRECGARRRAKESYERRKAAEASKQKGN